VLLVGVDGEGAVEPETVEIAAGHAFQALKASGVTELVLKLGGDAETAARAAFGVKLAAYRFDKYRTTEKAEKKPSVSVVKVAAADPAKAQKAFAALEAVADAILFSRDLVAEPANILHPEEFAARVKGLEAWAWRSRSSARPRWPSWAWAACWASGRAAAAKASWW
jgi:leucyl aminopeptidase